MQGRVFRQARVSRRTVLAGMGSAALAALAPPHARAQARRPVVAYLQQAARADMTSQVEAFLGAMADNGYNDGQTVTIAWAFADGDPARVPGLVQQIVAQSPDVIVAGNAVVAAAAQATATIPIVVPNLPTGQTLIANRFQPEKNLTGIITPELGAPGLFARAVQFLHGVTRVGWLLDTTSAAAAAASKRDAQVAAAGLNLTAFFGEHRGEMGIEDAVGALARQEAGAVFGLDNHLHRHNMQRIVAAATAVRMPAIGATHDWVKAKAMASVSVLDPASARVPLYVADLLRGAKVAGLPVGSQNDNSTAINFDVARALGITIPEEAALRAVVRIGQP